jgi:F-type H+-transporting ATPase subunit delta
VLKNPLLARKYAVALFEATSGKADLSAVESRIASVAAELRKPTISLEEVLDLLGAPESSEIRNLLAILVRRKRHVILGEIVEAYRMIQEESQGIRRASVTLASEPSASARAAVERAAASILRATTVKLEVSVNPDLIGGMMLRCGDQLIDGSVSAKLDAFRARF